MVPVERSFGPLTMRIDLTLCVGFGDCVTEAGAVFELTADGAVRFRDGAPDSTARSLLVAACQSCPVDALSLHDATGAQVAP
ncbi:MAG: ferredoxin [Gemmatimonadota bacterium]